MKFCIVFWQKCHRTRNKKGFPQMKYAVEVSGIEAFAV